MQVNQRPVPRRPAISRGVILSLGVLAVLSSGCIAPRIPRALAPEEGPAQLTVLLPVTPDDVSPPAREEGATVQRRRRDHENLAQLANKVLNSMVGDGNKLAGPRSVDERLSGPTNELAFLWPLPVQPALRDEQVRKLQSVGGRTGCNRVVLSRVTVFASPISNWLGDGTAKTVYVDLQLWDLNPPRQLARASAGSEGWIVGGAGAVVGGAAVWLVGETSGRTLERAVRRGLIQLFLNEKTKEGSPVQFDEPAGGNPDDPGPENL